jgi:hypothetical protein
MFQKMLFKTWFVGLCLWTLLLSVQGVLAQEFRGGDLTYRCLGSSGLFEFTAGVYVTCPGTVPVRDSLVLYQVTNAPGSVPVFLGWLRYLPSQSYSIADTSAARPPVSLINCSSTNSIIKDVRRLVFKGTIALDTVAVPAGGYLFFIPHTSEARSVVGGVSGGLPSRGLFPVDPADNLQPGIVGPTARLSARMLGFGGLRPQFTCDASPTFYNDPNPLFVANPNAFVTDSVTVVNMAIDTNLNDSISYHLGGPVFDTFYLPNNGLYSGSVFNTGTNPAGLTNLNALTGEFSFKPRIEFAGTTKSRYLWGLTVRSWRCNSLVSEVYREFVTEVIPRPTTGANPPFLENQKPPYFAANTRFYREVYAGDSLRQRFLTGDDAPVGLPAGTDNYIGVGARSPYLSQVAAEGIGTPWPAVCSTSTVVPLNPLRSDLPLGQNTGYGLFAGYGYSAINSTVLTVGWVPPCDSVFYGTCYNNSRIFPFLVTGFDYTPPLIGKQSRIFNVKVRNRPYTPAPLFYGVSVGDENDRVRLYFKSMMDTVGIDPLDSLNNILDNHGWSQAQLKAKSVNRRLESFHSYQVYRSARPTGPFVLVPNGSLTDPFADFFEDNDPSLRLDTGDYYYKILALSGCDVNLRYQETPVLKTVGGLYTNDKANIRGVLVWDTMGSQNVQYLTDSHQVQRRDYVMFSWDSLTTVVGYRIDSVLPFLFCNDSLNYRAGVKDNGTGVPGMVYWSRWIGAKFTLPDSMQIKYVSVDTSGIGDSVVVAWYPDPDTLRDYVEFRFFPIVPGLPALLTKPNRDPLTRELDSMAIEQVGLSASGPNFPAIVLTSVDTCGNLGGGSRPHRVVNLEAVAEPCYSRINLSWRDYEGWDDLSHYLVYRQDPGRPYDLLDTVVGNSYSDIDPSLDLKNIYRYLVVAENLRGFRSLSNLDTALYDIPAPQFSYIESASVDTVAFNSVHVRFNIPDDASIGFLELLRRDGPNGTFNRIDTLSNPVVLNGPAGTYRHYLYIDTTARVPGNAQYTYRVLVYDACYLLSDTSNDFSCLVLRAAPNDNYFNVIQWDRLVDSLFFEGEVDSFVVYRQVVDPVGGSFFFPLSQRVAGELPRWELEYEYKDPVDNIPTADGLFDYYILAFEKDNQWEFEGKSASNKVRVRQEPRAFFPTALYGGSETNGEFKPSFNYRMANDSSYSLRILNRWAKVVFESRNSDLGWKGYLGENQDSESGTKLPPDTYIYELNFRGADNKIYRLNGNLVLIW